MSLNSAINAALSGLNASSRATKLVADNLANSGTRAYGVRSLNLGAATIGNTGQGVAVLGISRRVDLPLLTELRIASSARSHTETIHDFWAQMETRLGAPDAPGSLSARIDALEVALRQAKTNPDSVAALSQVANTADAIVVKLQALQTHLSSERDRADHAIATDVTTLNNLLEQTDDLNRKIQQQTLLGGDPEGLLDMRQSVVDQISELIPIREIPREDGKIMLLGADGTILVDHKAAKFSFDHTIQPQPSETLAGGALSALMLNDTALSTGSPLLAQGRIGAHFALRDQEAPAMQTHLDQFTADLLSRFSGPDIDPTLAPNAFGLFTLSNATELPADWTGITGQIRLTPQIDTNDTSTLWRLRSGLNAAAPGPVGTSETLARMHQALASSTNIGAAGLPAQPTSGHASALVSFAGTARLVADADLTFHQTRESTLDESFAAQGVDTDAQLQKLLRLEQAYAANARVLSTVDAMMRRLMEI